MRIKRDIFRILHDLEGPIVYALTVTCVVVSLLVYGMTKLRSPGALFDDWRSVFGTGFGIVILLVMLGLLAINQRWLAVAGVFGVFGFNLMLGLGSGREEAMMLDEFIVTGNTLALLLLSACYYQGMLDS
ncbi:MAG: hypothetical protein AAF664_23420 [Planctomycetota bacterium]